jgi:UDP-glucose 6-dehydrogenase
MNVVMIGSGFVVWFPAPVFAEFGAHVTCIDVDEGKIGRFNYDTARKIAEHLSG